MYQPKPETLYCFGRAWECAYIGVMLRIEHGLPPSMRQAAAELYWEAFGAKLGKLLGPAPRGVAFFAQTVHPPSVLAALDGDDLLGIAAFQTDGTGFSQAGIADLFWHYGIGALWRLVPLAMLERSAPGDSLQMDGICVRADARGKGVGVALFQALFAHARAQGYAHITLDVIDSNPRARALYERLGFVATGTESTSFLQPLLGFSAATRMRLTL